jgi:hypothetical protein
MRILMKTVVAGIFLTWFLLFHADKNIMIGAHKGDTAKEILDKVKSIIYHLPFFLKPGLFSFNAYSLMTDANSRILASTTTEKAANGFTIHLLFLDEFAHVRTSIQRGFWDNIYPVMSANPNAKLIMTSTPNGYELFQEIFQAAVEGKNGFTHLSIPWWDVPGRDEKWAQKQIAVMGEDAFNEQFACQFQRSDLLLLNMNQLKQLKMNETEFIHHEFEVLDNYRIRYDNLVFKNTYNIENLKDDIIFISIDLAEGVGRDNTVMQFFKLTPKVEFDIPVQENEVFQLDKHFFLEQIGLFSDNLTSIEDFAKLVYLLAFSGKILNLDTVKIVLEWNTYGSFFDEKLKNLFGGELYDESVYLKTFHRKGATMKKIGIRQDAESKPRNCAELKNLIENRIIMIFDKFTSQEFGHFTRNKKGSYAAATGTDDRVMACVNVVEVFRDVLFGDLVAEYLDRCKPESREHILNLMNNANSIDSSTDFLADDFNKSFVGLNEFNKYDNIVGDWF